MSNFFFKNGRWLNTRLMRREVNLEHKIKERFCMYCISKGFKHMKVCPTKRPDFSPEKYPMVETDGTPINKFNLHK